jgi:hypothetical protein
MRRLLAFLSILCCVSPWHKALGAESLQDNHNTTRISEVFFAGLELDRGALDQLLKPAEEKANQRQNLAFGEDETQSSSRSSSQSGNDLAPSNGSTAERYSRNCAYTTSRWEGRIETPPVVSTTPSSSCIVQVATPPNSLSRLSVARFTDQASRWI